MKPISDPAFWKQRLDTCGGELHRVLCQSSIDQWTPIEEHHREILAKTIRENDNILDIGCGYGRLIDLLPKEWKGLYFGVDISPDLLAIAKAKNYPVSKYGFVLSDIRCLPSWMTSHTQPIFDWAVAISMEDMFVNNLGPDAWTTALWEAQKAARRVLLLEYNSIDPPEIILSLAHYHEIEEDK